MISPDLYITFVGSGGSGFGEENSPLDPPESGLGCGNPKLTDGSVGLGWTRVEIGQVGWSGRSRSGLDTPNYHKRKRPRFNITLSLGKSEDGFLITMKADIFTSSYSFSLSFSLVECSSPLSKGFSSLYIQLYCISTLHYTSQGIHLDVYPIKTLLEVVKREVWVVQLMFKCLFLINAVSLVGAEY